MSAIRVRNLTKVYARSPRIGDLAAALWGPREAAATSSPAVKGVSFDVEPGTALGLIGRNGAGKTTLLRLLSGGLQASDGEIEAPGRMATLIDLGAGIHPDYSGRENASLLMVVAGFDRREADERLDAVQEFSGLGDAFEDPVRTYSSGMVLRLAFSAAVQGDPEVVLIDEALAVGDLFFQQRCLARIRELSRGGSAIVLVSHDPAAVISFCDEVIWLDEGQVRARGLPADVLPSYLQSRGDSPSSPERSAPREPSIALADGFANVGNRYGDGRAHIVGIAAFGADGAPLREVGPGDFVRVVVSVGANAAIDSPVIGFTLRNRLGDIVTATNTDHESTGIPALGVGETVSAEFSFQWPHFASGPVTFSPAIADGSADEHSMCDWVDDAYALETVHPHARYGWFGIPGVRVRVAKHEGD